MSQILSVEDDPETAEAVACEVRGLGCTATIATTLAEGIALSAQNYHVIVLDRMLPGSDGVDAIAKMRAHGATAMILVLSCAWPCRQLGRGAGERRRRLPPETLRAGRTPRPPCCAAPRCRVWTMTCWCLVG